MPSVRHVRPGVEPLESRRLLAAVGDADLFGLAQTVHVSGASSTAGFAASNVVDGTGAAFVFNDGTGPQRLSVSNFNSAIDTLRFFDAPGLASRRPTLVAVYHAPVKQAALTPASYKPLGTFNLSAAAGFSELTGLKLPAGTESLLLDFGTNPAGVGFAIGEIQAFGYHFDDLSVGEPLAGQDGWNRVGGTPGSVRVGGDTGGDLFATLTGAADEQLARLLRLAIPVTDTLVTVTQTLTVSPGGSGFLVGIDLGFSGGSVPGTHLFQFGSAASGNGWLLRDATGAETTSATAFPAAGGTHTLRLVVDLAAPSGGGAATLSVDGTTVLTDANLGLSGNLRNPSTWNALFLRAQSAGDETAGGARVDDISIGSRHSADPTLLAWGLNVYQKINASLKVPGSSLYAETADLSGTRSGGNGGFAFVWPAATQFRVVTALTRLDPAAYRTALRSYSNELHTRYWRTASPGGYRSGVGSSSTVFYDDNGHLVVALAEAYHLTGDPVYLSRAVAAYNFVMTGEDGAGGGGIYFSEPDRTSKDAISTLQAVRAGLMLYQITGQSRYLTDATRLYNWAKTHIQQPDGLFRERFLLSTSAADGFTLINSAGIGISTNLLFYDTTGNLQYLQEAQRIGNTALLRYFNGSTGAINDEGHWAFELVTALGDLYLHDHNPNWLQRVNRALTWLRNNREDPNGHYGTLWGRDAYTPGTVRTSWHLNDQAAVAQSYLYTAAVASNTQTPVGNRAAVVGRAVFYNRGAFDGNDASANAADDGAIAPDKAALLRADDGSTANFTSYSRGINGVMFDVAHLPEGFRLSLTAADVLFHTAASPASTSWTPAPALAGITVRPGAGVGGSDRVTIVWGDNAIKNAWLRVTVPANTRTKLGLQDVLYFGNLIGETGLGAPAGGALTVNAIDLLRTRQALSPAATIDSPYDFNRDGRVSPLDVAMVRSAQRRSLTGFAPFFWAGSGADVALSGGKREDEPAGGPSRLLL